MQTQITVNEIKTELEALYRNVTGRKSLTAVEVDIVNASIIDAYQEVLLEYGVEGFKFHQVSDTVATVSGTNYVDLDEYCFRVVPGTVRIAAQQVVLGLIDEQAIYLADPELTVTGVPHSYAYAVSDDPNIVRLILYPCPDAAYTIAFKALKYPTDALTNFPIAVSSAIKYKAKGLACMQLGVGQLKPQFDDAYERIMAKVKDSYQEDTPRHVGRRRFVTRVDTDKE